MNSKHPRIDKNRYLEYKLSTEFETQVAKNTGKRYLVDSPPPTLSGVLHIGHLFSYTQVNAIIRYKGMNNNRLIVPFGIDENGIPTWKLIVNEAGREYFHANGTNLELADKKYGITSKYKDEYKRIFNKSDIFYQSQYQYSTLDDNVKKISQQIFIELYKKGDIYYKEWPVNWDTAHNTAVSNLEIISCSQKSEMHYIDFGFPLISKELQDKQSEISMDEDLNNAPSSFTENLTNTDKLTNIVIATTRPELLPACVAVLYNPNSPQAEFIKNKKIRVPLFGDAVPLIADDKVDPEKGTGYVMCCTFGDHTDVYWWDKFRLPLKQIINKDGKIDISESNYSSELNGLNVIAARKKMLTLLGQNLIKSEPIVHHVHCSERSGQPIEILNFPQWYLSSMKYKQEILNISNQINWIPESMKKKLEVWVENLNSDWCISRQRQWGIRIPIYHTENDDLVIPSDDDLPLNYSSKPNMSLDDSVLDTWFTSALTPRIIAKLDSDSSGEIKDNKVNLDSNSKENVELENENRSLATLRFHAHEIIRTWTFGSILVNHLVDPNSIPWKDLIVGGWCKANDGTKFSKSKGNAPNLDDLIDNYGIDAIKYWAIKAKIGNDVNLSEEVILNGKKFIQKVLNGLNFASQNFHFIDSFNSIEDIISNINHPTDLCFLNLLISNVKTITNNLENYETFEAFTMLELWFKLDFCDYYLEIIKKRFYDDNQNQLSATATCWIFSNVFLKILFPFMPKLSEYLYNQLFYENLDLKTLYLWPSEINHQLAKLTATTVDDMFDSIKKVIEAVRKFKTTNKLAMNAPINLIEINMNVDLPIEVILDIKNVTQATEIRFNLDTTVTVIVS